LVDDAGHGEGVVSRHKGHVVDGGVADDAGFDGGQRKSDVALGMMSKFREDRRGFLPMQQ
jgi:hypothetical protein